MLLYRLAVPGRPRQALIAVPLALIAAVPVADPFLPPDIHLNPVLFVAPAVTATFASPRRTALIGALALAALVIAGIERSALSTENVIVQMVALILLSALLVFFCNLRDRRERELVRVRSVSEATQRVVLRPLPESAGPVSVASAYHTAEADTYIGGDFYALARIADSTRLVIGDVRGKGLSSISETAIMLESFRAAARQQLPLRDMVSYMDGSARWGLAEFSRGEADVGERFVTLAVADIPDNEPLLRLILCGHPPPLLLHRGADRSADRSLDQGADRSPDRGTATALSVSQPAPPLGLGVLAGRPPAPQAFPFAPGDVLLLYTDGVTEARDEQGTFYPLAQRAAALARCPPAKLVKNIEADLRAYISGPLGDDMAMIAARREGPDGRGRAKIAGRRDD